MNIQKLDQNNDSILLLFIRHCSRREDPLINVSNFKNIAFDCHLAGFFLINLVMLGMMFLLPNYLQVALGLISMTAGLMLLPGSVLLFVIFGTHLSPVPCKAKLA